MSALTKNRDTPTREGREFAFVAGAHIFQGALVALDASGLALPASATGKVAVGVAQKPAGSGENVPVARGVFRFDNTPADALTRAHVGEPCYVADDQTVKKTAGSSPVAGMVLDVDASGVWIRI